MIRWAQGLSARLCRPSQGMASVHCGTVCGTIHAMTKLLEKAIEAVRRLSPERQDEVAEMMLATSSDGMIAVSEEERAAILKGLKEADAGAFASDEQVDALFAKHRAQ